MEELTIKFIVEFQFANCQIQIPNTNSTITFTQMTYITPAAMLLF